MSLRFEFDKKTRRIGRTTILSKRVPLNIDDTVPIGGVLPFAGISSKTPDGFLLCDGSAVSRNTYSRLFTVIGTKYGTGNGITTFNLPDMRLKFPLGASVDTITKELGNTGGVFEKYIEEKHMPSHTHVGTIGNTGDHVHSINDPGHSHSYNSVATNFSTTNIGPNDDTELGTNTTGSNTTGITIQSSGNHSHPISIANTGGSQIFNITNPYLTFNYIIKYKKF